MTREGMTKNMASTIEVVIRISEEDFEIMKHNVAIGRPICSLSEVNKMVSIIARGIPLPEGHGDLKDMGNLPYVFDLTREDPIFSGKEIEREIKSMTTIIPADKPESEVEKMNGSFELTLNNPLTKEDWDKIADVELENTPSITFKTPKGKQVKYIKSDILDKIKTEIERRCCITVGEEPAMTLYDVFQIIDKYKKESEDKE